MADIKIEMKFFPLRRLNYQLFPELYWSGKFDIGSDNGLSKFSNASAHKVFEKKRKVEKT